jgi:LPXTG-motif cell wall-anchored protein
MPALDPENRALDLQKRASVRRFVGPNQEEDIPMRLSKLSVAAIAIVATAALAFGQTENSNANTGTGKYRIALVSPNEGASVPADQVRVVLTPNTSAMGDAKTQVDVFLDGKQKGVIAANETDFRVDGVTPGAHKLTLIARNPVTDQQFDRREINFTATGDGTATTTSTSTTAGGETGAGAHVPAAVSSTERQHSYTATGATESAQNETASSTSAYKSSTAPQSSTSSSTGSSSTTTYSPAPSSSSSTASTAPSSSTYSNNPSSGAGSSSAYSSNPGASSMPSASSRSAASSTEERRSSARTDNGRLPATGSHDVLLAVAGAALLATGAMLRRMA